MTDIIYAIPVDLTVSKLLRHTEVKDKATATALAEELHGIVNDYKKLLLAHPPDNYPLSDKFTLADVIDTILRAAVGFDHKESDGAWSEAIWLFGQFDRVGGGDELYMRYLVALDKIFGTDVASLFTSLKGPRGSRNSLQ